MALVWPGTQALGILRAWYGLLSYLLRSLRWANTSSSFSFLLKMQHVFPVRAMRQWSYAARGLTLMLRLTPKVALRALMQQLRLLIGVSQVLFRNIPTQIWTWKASLCTVSCFFTLFFKMSCSRPHFVHFCLDSVNFWHNPTAAPLALVEGYKSINNGVFPTVGSLAGGNQVTIVGENFPMDESKMDIFIGGRKLVLAHSNPESIRCNSVAASCSKVISEVDIETHSVSLNTVAPMRIQLAESVSPFVLVLTLYSISPFVLLPSKSLYCYLFWGFEINIRWTQICCSLFTTSAHYFRWANRPSWHQLRLARALIWRWV